MKIIKRIFILCMAACMICSMTVTALADETSSRYSPPDYNKKGSVTVEMISAETKKAVKGGQVTIYKIASAESIEGNNVFVFTDEFAESGVDINAVTENDSGAKAAASALEKYVDSSDINGTSVDVDKNGQAVCGNLELGLYLIVNTSPADGYYAVSSFLVTVPRLVNGGYIYDVQANPKVDMAESVPGDNTGSVGAGDTGKLPQTGQLWWPVPVCAAIGVLLIILGLCSKRNMHNRRRGS